MSALREDPEPPRPRAGRVTALPPRPARRGRIQREREPQTSSVWHVLLALATCLSLSLVLDARGLIHSAQGMPDGSERTIALGVGQAGAAIRDTMRVTWIWDTLASIHGYRQQPSVPPLLAASPPPARKARHASKHIRHAGSSTRSTAHYPRTMTPRWYHRVTAAHPLRLLVTGDSLTEYLGPALVNDVSGVAPLRGFVEPHYGTGLVRPDYVDWSLVARQQVASDRPDVVVVMMGGNDFQNLVVANGAVLLSGTAAWTREYERRAEVCMRIWTRSGTKRVYWLSMPPARDAAWSRHNAEINVALRAAARDVPGVEYLDVNVPVTDHGRYADFVNVGGQPVLVREPDGIHLNVAGSEIVAREVFDVLIREWHLRRA